MKITKITLSLMLLSIAMSFTAIDASAQTTSETSGSVNTSELQDSRIQVPDIMFAGNEYIGIIYTHTDKTKLALIASSNESVFTVDASVLITDAGNHQFKIMANAPGIADINIDFDEQIISKQIKVYENNENKKYLKMIFPTNQTSITKIQGMVYLMEDDVPIISDEDLRIQIFTDVKKIDAPKYITIKKGGVAAKFDVFVYQDAEIQAIIDGIIPDSVELKIQKRNITMKVEAAPTILHRSSSGYLGVSLYENDKPFVGSQAIPVTIHTSNSSTLSMHIGQEEEKSFDEFIIDGTGMFRIYSLENGVSTITASIEGIGSQSINLVSGIATTETETISRNDTDTITQATEAKEREELADDLEANTLFLKIIPSITTGDAHIITGMYHTEKDTSISIDNFSEEVTITNSTVEVFYPIHVDDRKLKITSDGAIHKTDVEFETTNTKTHVNKFEISGKDSREYTVSVSAPGIEDSGSAKFMVSEPSSSDYRIQIQPLPVIQGYTQDMAIITLHVEGSNGERLMIDPRIGFNVQKKIIVHIDGSLEGEYSFGHSSTILINGLVSNTSHSIEVYESGRLHDRKTISTTNQDTKNEGHLFIPDTIYAFEKFPAYGYITNENGEPTRIVELLTTNGCKKEETSTTVGGMKQIICTRDGSIGMHHRYGFPYQNIEPIFRSLDNTEWEIPPEMRVGKTYFMDIEGGYDTVKVDTGIPYEIKDDGVLFLPDKQGIEDVTVTVEKEGYTSKTNDAEVSITDVFSLSINAYNQDGYPLKVPYTVIADKEITGTTPKTQELNKFETGVFFEDIFFDGNGNQYDIVETNLNGTIYDTQTVTLNPETNKSYDINAIYTQIVTLRVQDKYDAGYNKEYPIGTTARLTPPSNQPIILFFIQDVFEGYSTNTNLIVMDKDVQVKIIYREDHTGLLVTIIAAVLIGILALWKNDSEKIMRIIQVIDTSFKSNIKSKKKKKKGDQKEGVVEGEPKKKKGLFGKLGKKKKKKKDKDEEELASEEETKGDDDDETS